MMKLSRRGLIATIIYHTLVVLLLIFAGLTYPDPPPEEEGILVNFGTDNTGFGNFEPMGDDQQAGDPELPVEEESQEIAEEVEQVRDVQETYTPPDPTPVDNTQDLEETPVKENPEPTKEELERQRQEELEQQRLAELERQRLEQERIERERQQAEQERIERERQRAEQLNNMGRDAFGRQGEGETEGSEGITEGSGNQGVVNGSPNADNYDTGGGLGDNPGNYGLGSRKVIGSLPKPDLSTCSVTSRIVITMNIQVDREGKVIYATKKEGTFTDQCIDEMVKRAALRSRFTPDPNAPFRQNGWIKYIIVP